jgi:hypothetical protein
MRSYVATPPQPTEPPEPEYPCLKISTFGTVYLVTRTGQAVVILQGNKPGASPFGIISDRSGFDDEELKPYTGPAIVLEP